MADFPEKTPFSCSLRSPGGLFLQCITLPKNTRGGFAKYSMAGFFGQTCGYACAIDISYGVIRTHMCSALEPQFRKPIEFLYEMMRIILKCLANTSIGKYSNYESIDIYENLTNFKICGPKSLIFNEYENNHQGFHKVLDLMVVPEIFFQETQRVFCRQLERV